MRPDPVVGQGVLELAAAVGGVAVKVRRVLRMVAVVALVTIGEVIDQVGSDRAITDVAGADLGVSDDLAVRIGRDMPFVAVEPAGLGLVAVPGLRVHGGDDPVLGDPPGDR